MAATATEVTPRERPEASSVANLSPGYFALVMATGIVSIAADQRGYRGVAIGLLWVNSAAYVVLWVLTLLRLARYPRRMLADLASHRTGAAFLTVVAGTNVLGSQFAVVTDVPALAVALWWVGLFLWAALLYAFPHRGHLRGAQARPRERDRRCLAAPGRVHGVDRRPGHGRRPAHRTQRRALRLAAGAPRRGHAVCRRDRVDLLPVDLLLHGCGSGNAAVLDQHGRAGHHDARGFEPGGGGPQWELLRELTPFLKGPPLFFWALRFVGGGSSPLHWFLASGDPRCASPSPTERSGRSSSRWGCTRWPRRR